MTLWDQTLSAFRDEVASARPTPGGGSVCAVSASLGLGLVIMALEITHKRTGGDPQLVERARSLLVQLSESADADVRAYDGYTRAYKLPRSNEAEIQTREHALQRAAQQATEVPLLAARQTVEALELAATAEVSPHIRSDVIAGAELLHASFKGLLATLTMNLATLDAPTRARVVEERERLAARATTALASTLS